MGRLPIVNYNTGAGGWLVNSGGCLQILYCIKELVKGVASHPMHPPGNLIMYDVTYSVNISRVNQQISALAMMKL